ncbi:urokinase plasminogen activator surface receptor-like [Garra rufa]|uniref:urokinase plasminogen activator surface receptor-like n=1 Tax=Garra rufa TaxID=137080 RepID=UPI003CCE7BDA
MGDSCTDQEVKTSRECPRESMCMSQTAVFQQGNKTTMSRSRGCLDNCHSGSQNVGILRAAIVCCNTDLCNAQYAPDPRTMFPNGKKCYSCDEKSCLNIMSCSESEDGCITVTSEKKEVSGTSGGQPRDVKGCISKHKCDLMVSSSREHVTCCSGNLCNGAQSVAQGFLFLCCSLLTFFLLH